MNSLVLFGSSPFSVIVLEKILNSSTLQLSRSAIVTTPDQPAGRHLKLTPNPVKALAQQHNILVIESLGDLISNFKFQTSNSLGLVAAYGKIIPQSVLNLFHGRIYNIHPSLLPKYRGPSPLQQQILDGITDTGVTIIQLDALMDHGPIVAVAKDTIHPDDTWLTLGNRLFAKGAELFIKNYLELKNCKQKIQDASLAPYTKNLPRQSGFLPLKEFNYQLKAASNQLYRMHRGFAGWPGIWSIDPSGSRVKLVSLNPVLVQYAGHKPQTYVPS